MECCIINNDCSHKFCKCGLPHDQCQCGWTEKDYRTIGEIEELNKKVLRVKDFISFLKSNILLTIEPEDRFDYWFYKKTLAELYDLRTEYLNYILNLEILEMKWEKSLSDYGLIIKVKGKLITIPNKKENK